MDAPRRRIVVRQEFDDEVPPSVYHAGDETLAPGQATEPVA